MLSPERIMAITPGKQQDLGGRLFKAGYLLLMMMMLLILAAYSTSASQQSCYWPQSWTAGCREILDPPRW